MTTTEPIKMTPAKETRYYDVATLPPEHRRVEMVGVRNRYNYPNATNFEGERDYMMVRERPIESVRRRLSELGITQKQMARTLGISERHVSMALTETAEVSHKLLFSMLAYVGMEMVAIPSLSRFDQDGHWFFGERCQYCNVNMYDLTYNSDTTCPENPNLKKENADG
jgi:transcriptional regulator with XRE-family HTH domain